MQLRPTRTLGLRATFDYGMQRRPAGGIDAWRGWAVIARWTATTRVAAAARWEWYSDPEQVIVATGQPYGLRVGGGSFNVDVVPAPHLLWRTELRGLRARDPLFPRGASELTRRDGFVVSSLALTF